MRLSLLANKLFMVLSIFGGTSAFAGASMTGYELRHCTESRQCVLIKGAQADRSSFANVWVVSKANVTMLDEASNKVLNKWDEKTVLIDEKGSQILIKDFALGKEWQINLDNLKVVEPKL